jgi:(S)-2-hydroxyglutarate dehydrogenase
MNSKKKIVIVGGGIIGLTIAYELSNKYPNILIEVHEKENIAGSHQSTRNSGVMHCGLHYKPGSLKAKLSSRGIKKLIQFCDDYRLQYEVCGKIVVANSPEEELTINHLLKNGKKNGLENLKILNKSEIKIREPFVKCNKALLVPGEGIVDYKAVITKLCALIKDKGHKIYFNSKITNISEKSNNKIIVTSENSEIECDYIINCGGLFSDRILKLSQMKSLSKIIPFRGEYFKLKPEANALVNHLIYPSPDIKFPFLGVHFTRLINGDREVGPNAVLAFQREGYNNTDFSLKDTIETITYKGLRKFVFKNFIFSLNQLKMSMSKELFLVEAQKLIPDIAASDIIGGRSGVRAQAMNENGKLLEDFEIKYQGNQLHVLNAPSPAATSSFAIAEHIVENYLSNL